MTGIIGADLTDDLGLGDDEGEDGTPIGDKWIRTRKCGCGECRYMSIEQMPVCPMENAPGALWLWRMNSDFIGMKDYADNFNPFASDPTQVTLEEESPAVAEVD